MNGEQAEDIRKTLVLGVGNLLLSDEGLGLHVIRRLQERYTLPEAVQVLDGGTLGMDLLYYLEGCHTLLIVDVVETGQAPGALLRLAGDDVPAFLSVKVSPHQVGIPDMLFAARLRGSAPPDIVLWGAQPATFDIGLELSPALAAQVDVLVDKLRQELTNRGHTLVEVDTQEAQG